MKDAGVVVVGSGIVGTAVSSRLVSRGLRVTMVEKGPEYAYPHALQFADDVVGLLDTSSTDVPPDLKRVTSTGDYGGRLDRELFMRVGGTGTVWSAETPRMLPEDFKTHSLFGIGRDWPIDYESLEPFYCDAEDFLGVSGSDVGNPVASPRSRPYPLPAFEHTSGDLVFRERLGEIGIHVHSIPQARTRLDYGSRPACQNVGVCRVCPIGARYSPNGDLQELVAGGQLTLLSGTSARRVIVERDGRASGILCQRMNETEPFELPARAIVIAANAFETARLLLLSPSSRHPQGLGNDSNAVGSTLTMHHGYLGQFDLDTRIFSGRAGPLTAASYQFLRPEARGRHGTALFAFNSSLKRARLVGDFGISGAADGPDVVRRTERMPYRRYLAIVCESVPSKKKYLTLSSQRDRFGDPFAHVHYEMNDFDRETHRYVKAIFGRMSHALRCTDSHMRPVERYGSVAHHMGTCPMGDSDADSVTNSFGQVYGSPNLFLGGGAIFPGGNGAVNPTLTMVALALRTAEFIADQFNVLANRKS